MKKILITFGMIVVVVIFSGCGAKKTENSQSQNGAGQSQAEQATPEKKTYEKTFTGTTKDLLDLEKPMMCKVAAKSSSGSVASTIFVSDKKFNEETEITKSDGSKVTRHTIFNGEYSFMWSDASNKGIKVKIDATEFGNISPDASKIEFKCTDWSEDLAKFSSPSGIEFTLMTKDDLKANK